MDSKRYGRWAYGPDGCIIEDEDQPYPTATALMFRLPIFQPTQRPVFMLGDWFTTAWGQAKVTGRLGQRHASALGFMLGKPRSSRVTSDGGIELLVDPADLRAKMAGPTAKAKQYSAEQLDVLFRDLKRAEVEIKAPNIQGLGAIIDHIYKCDPCDLPEEQRPVARVPTGWASGVPRRWWRVRLGAPAATLLASDLCLTRDPSPINALPHGITQAVVRLLMTHRDEPNGGWWYIDRLLDAVSYGQLTPTARRNRRRELKLDCAQLASLGLQLDVDSGRVRRTQARV